MPSQDRILTLRPPASCRQFSQAGVANVHYDYPINACPSMRP
jgi:hypothetical protein